MQTMNIPKLRVPGVYTPTSRPLEVPLPVMSTERNEKSIPRVFTDPLFNMRVRNYYRTNYDRTVGMELLGRASGTAIGAAKGAYAGTLIGGLVGLGSYALSALLPDFGTIAVGGTALASAIAGAKTGRTVGAGIGAVTGLVASDYTTGHAMADLIKDTAGKFVTNPVEGIFNSLYTVGRSMDIIGGGETIRAAIYAGLAKKNLIKTIMEAYGMTPTGREDYDTEHIRERLGIDLGKVGNWITDFLGDVLTDPGFVTGISTTGFSKLSKIASKNIDEIITNTKFTNDILEEMANDKALRKTINKAILEEDQDTIVKLFAEQAAKSSKDIPEESLEIIERFMKEARDQAKGKTANDLYDLFKQVDSIDDAITGKLYTVTMVPFTALRYGNRLRKLFKGVEADSTLGKINYFFFGNKANYGYKRKLDEEFEKAYKEELAKEHKIFTDDLDAPIFEGSSYSARQYRDLLKRYERAIDVNEKRLIQKEINELKSELLKQREDINIRLDKARDIPGDGFVMKGIGNFSEILAERVIIDRYISRLENPILSKASSLMWDIDAIIKRISRIKRAINGKYKISDAKLQEAYQDKITQLIDLLTTNDDATIEAILEELSDKRYDAIFDFIRHNLDSNLSSTIDDVYKRAEFWYKKETSDLEELSTDIKDELSGNGKTVQELRKGKAEYEELRKPLLEDIISERELLRESAIKEYQNKFSILQKDIAKKLLTLIKHGFTIDIIRRLKILEFNELFSKGIPSSDKVRKFFGTFSMWDLQSFELYSHDEVDIINLLITNKRIRVIYKEYLDSVNNLRSFKNNSPKFNDSYLDSIYEEYNKGLSEFDSAIESYNKNIPVEEYIKEVNALASEERKIFKKYKYRSKILKRFIDPASETFTRNIKHMSSTDTSHTELLNAFRESFIEVMKILENNGNPIPIEILNELKIINQAFTIPHHQAATFSSISKDIAKKAKPISEDELNIYKATDFFQDDIGIILDFLEIEMEKLGYDWDDPKPYTNKKIDKYKKFYDSLLEERAMYNGTSVYSKFSLLVNSAWKYGFDNDLRYYLLKDATSMDDIRNRMYEIIPKPGTPGKHTKINLDLARFKVRLRGIGRILVSHVTYDDRFALKGYNDFVNLFYKKIEYFDSVTEVTQEEIDELNEFLNKAEAYLLAQSTIDKARYSLTEYTVEINKIKEHNKNLGEEYKKLTEDNKDTSHIAKQIKENNKKLKEIKEQESELITNMVNMNYCFQKLIEANPNMQQIDVEDIIMEYVKRTLFTDASYHRNIAEYDNAYSRTRDEFSTSVKYREDAKGFYHDAYRRVLPMLYIIKSNPVVKEIIKYFEDIANLIQHSSTNLKSDMLNMTSRFMSLYDIHKGIYNMYGVNLSVKSRFNDVGEFMGLDFYIPKSDIIDEKIINKFNTVLMNQIVKSKYSFELFDFANVLEELGDDLKISKEETFNIASVLGFKYTHRVAPNKGVFEYRADKIFKDQDYNFSSPRIILSERAGANFNNMKYRVTMDTETTARGRNGLVLQMSVRVVDHITGELITKETFYLDPDDYAIEIGKGTKYAIDQAAIDTNGLTVEELRKRKAQPSSENTRFITHQDLKLIFSEKGLYNGAETAISYMFRDDSIVLAHNAKFDFAALLNNFDEVPDAIYDNKDNIIMENLFDYFDINVIDSVHLAKKFNIYGANKFTNESIIQAFFKYYKNYYGKDLPYAEVTDPNNVLDKGLTLLVTTGDLYYNGKLFHDADIDIDVTDLWVGPTFEEINRMARQMGQSVNDLLNGDVDKLIPTIHLVDEDIIEEVTETDFINEATKELFEQEYSKLYDKYQKAKEYKVISEKISELEDLLDEGNEDKLIETKTTTTKLDKIPRSYAIYIARLLVNKELDEYLSLKSTYSNEIKNIANLNQYLSDTENKLFTFRDNFQQVTKTKSIKKKNPLFTRLQDICSRLNVNLVDGNISKQDLERLYEHLEDDYFKDELISDILDIHKNSLYTDKGIYTDSAQKLSDQIDKLYDLLDSKRIVINKEIDNFHALTKRYHNMGYWQINRNYVRTLLIDSIYFDNNFNSLLYILTGDADKFVNGSNEYTLSKIFKKIHDNHNIPSLQEAVHFLEYTRDSIEWERNILDKIGTYDKRELDLFYQLLEYGNELKRSSIPEDDYYFSLYDKLQTLIKKDKNSSLPTWVVNEINNRLLSNNDPIFMLDAADNFSNKLYEIVYVNLLNPLSDLFNEDYFSMEERLVFSEMYKNIKNILLGTNETNRGVLKAVKEANRINKLGLNTIDVDDFIANSGKTPFDLIKENYKETISYSKSLTKDQRIKNKINKIFGDLYKEIDDSYIPFGRATARETAIGNVIGLMADTLGISIEDFLDRFEEIDIDEYSKVFNIYWEDLLKDTSDPLFKPFILINSEINKFTPERMEYINDTEKLKSKLRRMFMAHYYENKALGYEPIPKSYSKSDYVLRNVSSQMKDSYKTSGNLFKNLKSIFYKNNGNYDEAANSFRNFFRNRKDLVLVYVDNSLKLRKIKTEDLASLKEVLKDNNTPFSVMSNADYIKLAGEVQPVQLPNWLQSIHKYLILPQKLFSITFSIPFLVNNMFSAYIQNATTNGFHPVKAFNNLIDTARLYHKWKNIYHLAVANKYIYEKFNGDYDKINTGWLDMVKSKDADFKKALKEENAEEYEELIRFIDEATPEELNKFVEISERSSSVAAWSEIIDLKRNTVVGKKKKEKYEALKSSTKKSDIEEFWVINEEPNKPYSSLKEELAALEKIKTDKLPFNKGPINNLYRRINIIKKKLNGEFSDRFIKFQKYTGMKWWLDINSDIEIIFRLSMMDESMKIGKELSEASQDVIDRHFIYNDKSVAERMAEIVIPFVSYPIKAANLFSELTQDKQFMKVMYLMNKYSWGDEEAEGSDYLMTRKAKGDIPIGDKLYNLGNPFMESLLTLSQPMQSINNKLNPIAKPLVDLAAGSEYNRWNQLLGPFSGVPETVQEVMDEQTFNPGTLLNYSNQYHRYNDTTYYRAYPQRSTFYKHLYTSGGYSRVSMNMQQATLDNLRYRVGDILYKSRQRR